MSPSPRLDPRVWFAVVRRLALPLWTQYNSSARQYLSPRTVREKVLWRALKFVPCPCCKIQLFSRYVKNIELLLFGK